MSEWPDVSTLAESFSKAKLPYDNKLLIKFIHNTQKYHLNTVNKMIYEFQIGTLFEISSLYLPMLLTISECTPDQYLCGGPCTMVALQLNG